MGITRTYWFTIAAGSAYRAMAGPLADSLRRHGIDLHVLGHDSLGRMEAKHLKIEGILSAPSRCRRIVYLDADTLVLNPQGIEMVDGSWQIPWRIPTADCIPRALDRDRYTRKLAAFYRDHDLTDFASGGPCDGVEWNSGVIVGDRDWLRLLVDEWGRWWDRMLDLFEGHFRRDQVSYSIAYHQVCKKSSRSRDLPAAYNWVVSYFGINPNANILHRTMVRNHTWLEEDWNAIVVRLAAGDKLTTRNRLFDLKAISDVKPCLGACVHADRQASRIYLQEAIRLKNPRKVLVLGEPFQVATELLSGHMCATTCLGWQAAREQETLVEFDFIIFNACRYAEAVTIADKLSQAAVGCMLHGHRLDNYQVLFQFAYVRFIAYEMVIFSNSEEIVGWRFHDERR